MRKIILTGIVLIVLLLIFSPYIIGVWVENKYRDWIAASIHNENYHVTLTKYKRGWFTSEATIQVKLNPVIVQAYLGDEAVTKAASEITFVQQIYHGPIIYRAFPFNSLALAMIENKVNLRQELPDNNIKNIKLIYWVLPQSNRLKCEIKIDLMLFGDADDSLAISNLNVMLNQVRDKSDLWFGFDDLNISSIELIRSDQDDFHVHDLKMQSESVPEGDFLNASRNIRIGLIQFGGRSVGPMTAKIKMYGFSISAIHDLILAYNEIAENGERYQGQLRQRISQLVPKMINAGSYINLDEMNIVSSYGNIDAKGKFLWSENNFVAPDNLRDTVLSGQAHLKIVVSKKMLAEIIRLASTIPEFIRDVAEPQQQSLINARDDMDFALRRNSAFVEELLDMNYITKQAEELLINMQNNLIPMDDYAKSVRDLYLDRQIALIVSYQLCMQYQQILRPYYFLQSRYNQFQNIAHKQIQDILNGWLKKRFVIEDGDRYEANILWTEDAFTSNGVKIE